MVWFIQCSLLLLCLEAPSRRSHAEDEGIVPDASCAPSVSRHVTPPRSNRYLVFHNCERAICYLVVNGSFGKQPFMTMV